MSGTVHPKIIDLDVTVQSWAKQIFRMTKKGKQKKLSEDDDLDFTIHWNKLVATHMEPDYNDKVKPELPKSQVLFRTTFTNTTAHEQEYSFKTERTTRSSCAVMIEKAVTYNQSLGISLKMPGELLEVGAGFNREVALTKSSGESFEQEITWGVDNQVRVPPKTKTVAELIVTEDHMETNFTAQSKISGPVTVTVTNRRDNNAFVKAIYGDIVEICRKAVELSGVTVESKYVSYATKGKCSFRFGVEQFVHLREEPL